MKAQPDQPISIDDNNPAIRERLGDLAHQHFDDPETPEPSPLDRDWPQLYEGQPVEFMGCPFIVHRINSSNLCIRPATGIYSARDIMNKMRMK